MKEYLSELRRFVEDQVRLALIFERTKGNALQMHSILEAQQSYFDTLQASYEQWSKENPHEQLSTFLYSPSRDEAPGRERFPRFFLPSKRGGNREPVTELHKQLVLDDYEKCFQGLKKLKRSYRNPNARKLIIEEILKKALGVESIPEDKLKEWCSRTPRDIALCAATWHNYDKYKLRDSKRRHSKYKPSYIKRQLSKLKRTK